MVEFKKVEGKINPADMMTKYVGPGTLVELCNIIGTSWKTGRADSSLELKR